MRKEAGFSQQNRVVQSSDLKNRPEIPKSAAIQAVTPSAGREEHAAPDASPARFAPDLYLALAYAYDGTPEGLLTAVFRAYELREDPDDIAPAKDLQPRLGQYVRDVEADPALAKRVADGICRVAGADAYNLVKVVAQSCVPGCGTLVYRFVRYAMKTGRAWEREVMHPSVEPMLRVKRSMANEKERLLQFIRFEELEGDLWLATCNPKANLVPFVMDFFSARFNTQRFIIYDEVHHLAGVHDRREDDVSPHRYTGKGSSLRTLDADLGEYASGRNTWYLVPTEGTGFPDNLPKRSDNEEAMRRAWKAFYDAVAVEARYNPELRVRWMPRRFWKNLVEITG